MKSSRIKQVAFVGCAIGTFLFLVLKYVDPKKGPFAEARLEAKAFTRESLCRGQKSCLQKIENHFEPCFRENFKLTQGNAWYKTLDYFGFRNCLTKKVGKLP